jgi:hypothetical protein
MSSQLVICSYEIHQAGRQEGSKRLFENCDCPLPKHHDLGGEGAKKCREHSPSWKRKWTLPLTADEMWFVYTCVHFHVSPDIAKRTILSLVGELVKPAAPKLTRMTRCQKRSIENVYRERFTNTPTALIRGNVVTLPVPLLHNDVCYRHP